MISRIHNKLGTAGFIVAIVALVAALGGGAYAAQQGLNAKQKKQVKTIAQTEAKKFSGVPGPPGAPGAPGAKGDKGDKGDTGNTGADGEDGKSVKSSAASLAECPAGGTKFTIETSPVQTSKACNGVNALEEPVIPAGESLYGHWGASIQAANQVEMSPISFTLAYPDPAGPDFVFVTSKEVAEEEAPAECSGSSSNPTAAPGFLCVYTNPAFEAGELPPLKPDEQYMFTFGFGELDDHGVVMVFRSEFAVFSGGTWAVTAPEAP